VRDIGLTIAWGVVALVFAVALAWELSAWRSLSARAAQAAAERSRLTAAILAKEEEVVREMRAHAGSLQAMQWTAPGGDAAAFLTRLADLAQGGRMKVTAIGPLEQHQTKQFGKSWHTVHVVGPYAELKGLATRVERERGVLEDVVVEVPPDAAVSALHGPGEIRARFKLTALELSAEARKILDRAMSAAGGAPRAPDTARPSLALPVPSPGPAGPPPRDPFQYAAALPAPAAPRRPPDAPGTASSPGVAAPPTPAAPAPVIPVRVSGIVDFPGGALAIVNDQIVKAGDMVSGFRVERITDREVMLRQPDGTSRSVELTELSAAPPAASRR
jgi:hypothetical protein